jgi:diguanylate cyclase (GGDEF)-like protein/PAS domain S-box-containing protein
MGSASSPARDEAVRAPSDARGMESPLDHFDAVTDLDVLALSTPLGVFRSTEADGVVWVNRRFLEIFALSQDEVLGRGWIRAVHPLDRRRVELARRDLYAEPHELGLQFRVVRSDGVLRHVRVRVLPGADRREEPRVFVGAMEDVTERVEACEALERGTADDPFRSLVVASALGVVYSDVVGRIVYVNDRYLEICGVAAEDVIGTDDLRVAHPDDRDAIFESMSAASQAREEWFGEMRVLRPNGEIRHTRTSIAAVRAPDGAINGYVGTLEDVTDEAEDRKRVEVAIQARAATEALIAETSRMLVTASVEDVDGRVISVLEQLARFVGADSAILAARASDVDPGASPHAWYAPELGPPGPATDAEWAAATEEAIGSVTLTWRHGGPRGSREDREPLAVVGDALISTLARVRAEQTVRTSEERFRSLAEHSSDYVLVYGEQGEVKYVSPSTARFSGLEVGSSFTRPGIVHPDDVGLVADVFGPLRERGGGATCRPFELRIRGGNGEYRWLEMVATNLLGDGLIDGIVVNARDVTERRQARGALEEMNASLARTNAALSRMVDEKLEVESQLRESEELFRAIVQNSTDAITLVDADGTVRYGSSLGEKVLGYPYGFAAGLDALDLVHPDDAEMVADVMSRAFTEPGTHGPVVVRVLHSDGSWRHLEAIGNNLLDNPAVRGVVVAARDVTERVATEEALRRSDDRFRALVQNLSDVITIVGPEGRLVYSSPAAKRLFGFEEDDESWADPTARVHPDDIERVVEEMTLRLEGGGSDPVAFRLRVADGSYREVEAIVQDLTDDPSVGGIVATTRDVTERARAEAMVASQAQILRLIAEGVPLAETLATICTVVERRIPDALCSVMLVDDEDRVLRIGAAPNLPLEYTRAIECVEIGPDAGSCGSAAHYGTPIVVEDIATDPRWASYREIALDHGLRACWSTPVMASSGDRVLGTFAVYHPEPQAPLLEAEEIVAMVSPLAAIAIERKTFEDRLAYQAQHDPLTGLPNRLLFVEFLTLALARSQRRQSTSAVLFLDLDRFKVVNDSLGHDAGDELMVNLSTRLCAAVRPGDTVARFGGDEFTVLCDDLSPGDARNQAIDVARRLLEVIEAPIQLNGEDQHLSASIGIALAGPADTPETLLRDADAAMYRAKADGKGRWELFDEAMRSSTRSRLETENALHRALERDELRVFYQPIVELDGGTCSGAEALVRWQHPDRGLVAPDAFIELAEETGLIVPIGAWVLEEACRQLVVWTANGQVTPGFTMAINLSARQLAQSDLVDRVADALERTGAPPAQVCLEITESVLMAETTIEAIDALRALGVRLSIDDFGTGYSSLGYLRRFPVDSIKVDRSFVDGLGTEAEDSAIVAAVVGLGHALGLSVVAEGVETELQLAELGGLGCDRAQGFFFSPPQPADVFASVVANSRHWQVGLKRPVPSQ